jgi:hypothetical protein
VKRSKEVGLKLRVREHLYRGKCSATGIGSKFIYGSLLVRDGKYSICENIPGGNYYDIIPETICQFTGLCDHKEVKIFELDLVKSIRTSSIGQVIFRDGRFDLKWNKHDNYFVSLGAFRDELVVVGNVFDNCDLLEIV